MTDLPIVFVEAQGYPDKEGTLYSSFFSEIFLYLHDYQPVNDWESVLMFTKRSLDPGLPKQYSDFSDSPHFRRVYLDELGDSENLSIGLSLLKLVVIKKAEAPAFGKRLIARSRIELSDARRAQNFIESVVTILVYKLGRVDRAEIEAMITIPEIRKSRFFQEVKAEGREEVRITAVSAMLKVDIPLERIAELLETDLESARRAAIPYLLETEMSLEQIAAEWALSVFEVTEMAIASFTILNAPIEEIATRLNIAPQALQTLLKPGEQS